MRFSPPALNTSAGIPSGPGALPVCSCLMAASTSAALGGASSSVTTIMGHQVLFDNYYMLVTAVQCPITMLVQTTVAHAQLQNIQMEQLNNI